MHLTLGLAALVTVGAGSILAGRALCDWLLRGRRGDRRLLAVCALGLAVFFLVSQVLGSVGGFRPVSMTLSFAAVGLLGVAVSRRFALKSSPWPRRPEPAIRADAVSTVGLGVVTGLVAARFLRQVQLGRTVGIIDSDSKVYHLPHAVDIAQSGWVSRIVHLIPGAPQEYHPANSELLHALGLTLLESEVLTYAINLGWITFGVLAGWSCSRTPRWGPLTALVTCVVLFAPGIWNGPNALTDAASIAFALAAVAFILEATDSTGGEPSAKAERTWAERYGPWAVAGATAGVAVSLKLSVAPFLGLASLGVPWMAVKGERLRTTAAYWIPMLATGSYWYLRNLVRVGHPIPSIDLGPFERGPQPWLDELDGTLLEASRYPDAWGTWFEPAFDGAFGPMWPLVLLMGIGSPLIVLGMTFRDNSAAQSHRVDRVLAGAALVAIAVHAVTPTSAGTELLALVNLRYVGAPLLIGPLLMMGGTGPRSRFRSGVALFAVAVAVSVVPRGTIGGGSGPADSTATLFALSGASIALMAWSVRRSLRWKLDTGEVRRLGALVLLASMPLMVLTVRQGALSLDASRGERAGLEGFFNDKTDVRVALDGMLFSWSAVGRSFDNEVRHLGRTGPDPAFRPLETCDDWRFAVHRGGFDYVVVGGRPVPGLNHDARPWAETDPGLSVVFESGPASDPNRSTVFEVLDVGVTVCD